ncbi:hypothetical protein NLO74_09285 [Pseudomonas tremae]|uniref:STM4504/CBY_0614 family protein n=1 Tax=Pseudomonas syringae group TaxID=136849 RepID=UPI0006CC8875|nr:MULTISPECIES: hypothetical protein [Pseudomonas syringae group]KPB55834.1 Uncharacterized protein AC511_4545 [Pseudomonas coronafaciens pv. oryzae]KPY04847.1 hypothetical protein ALO57_200192 [Pseudomonas coronafaciens pv. oryzae]MCQ3026204.1 hypothetical protein [Pseudomonas tremae]
MAIIDLYSKRQDRERNGLNDVYTYDEFSSKFRIQLSMMIEELLGGIEDVYRGGKPRDAYEGLVKILRKEYGLSHLVSTARSFTPDYFSEIHDFLSVEVDVGKVLDAVEVAYKLGNRFARHSSYRLAQRDDSDDHVDACIEELNGRFKEAGYGYAFVEDNILRVDSEFLHSEVVKPAIHFLNFEGFKAARNEFLGGYGHYRHQRYKEALADAGKSFESTMKIICGLNGWTFKPTDGANKLIQVLVDKEFLPSIHQAHLSGIHTVLSAGIPTLRNKWGSHGDGDTISEVHPDVVAYGLHLTASAIVFLGSLQENHPNAIEDKTKI